MAKLYGGRWRTINGPRLGTGGQSEVFRVVDEKGEHPGEYALKRVLNPKRRQRFRNEVDAIKRLTHANVVRLIDHSALDDAEAEERQYLVMPIAAGGDLARPERLSLYKEMIDGVVQAGKQLASAIAAAHAAGIIHRDTKPGNILFTGNGHEVWLVDFGICLLREQPRATETAEAVGPRSFMAPELEEGGQLDVTPAADIYSLGKVLFYMLSGGVVLPRERLHEEQYAHTFAKGERYRLLQLLLGRMICPLPSRLQSMSPVIDELQRIEDWEQRARVLPMSPEGLAKIEALQSRAVESRRVAAENASAREIEAANLRVICEGFKAWLKGDLEKVAAHIASIPMPLAPVDETSGSAGCRRSVIAWSAAGEPRAVR